MKPFRTLSLLTIAVIVSLQFISAADKPKAGGKETLLVDLKPVDTEWGTFQNDLFPNHGPMTSDWGSNGNSAPNFWPESVKIIKTVDKNVTIPEGKQYQSTMEDCFAVGGEFMTGVGLWSRRMLFYHWVEYDIPAGAKKFYTKLYVTDDPRGYAWWGNANQQFEFAIFIDGKEVIKSGKTRLGLEYGSGEMLEDFTINIPEGAKKIRFQVQNSGWGDGNANTELLLNDAKFLY